MSKLIHNHEILKEKRRGLRQRQTKAEEILWQNLRDQNLGVKFKRQHSISGYILDFYCPQKKLIIELDGEIHKTPEVKEWDRIRNEYFESLDYKVLRFWNGKVEKDIKVVLNKIREFVI